MTRSSFARTLAVSLGMLAAGGLPALAAARPSAARTAAPCVYATAASQWGGGAGMAGIPGIAIIAHETAGYFYPFRVRFTNGTALNVPTGYTKTGTTDLNLFVQHARVAGVYIASDGRAIWAEACKAVAWPKVPR